MKKTWLFYLALWNLPALAFAQSFNFFEISVQNNTPATCYLTKIKLIHGTYNAAHLPSRWFDNYSFKIAPGEKMTLPRFMEEFSYGPKLDLYYECESGRAIVLQSEKTLWRKDNLVNGRILSSDSMDASYTSSTPASYWDGVPGKINWVLF